MRTDYSPKSVELSGQRYLVWYDDDGNPCTVMVCKSNRHRQRIWIDGPVARAAIAKADGRE